MKLTKKLVLIPMIISPLSIVSCSEKNSEPSSEMKRLIEEYANIKENVTYLPNLDIDTFEIGKNYSPESLGFSYDYERIRGSTAHLSIISTDQLFRGELNVKLTISHNGISISRETILFGFRPTDERYVILKNSMDGIWDYSLTSLQGKRIEDFFKLPSDNHIVTPEEIGLDLSHIPSDVAIELKDITHYSTNADNNRWMPNQLNIEVTLRKDGAMLTKKIWLHGFLPFTSHITDEDFEEEINDILRTIEFNSMVTPITTPFVDRYPGHYREWEYYSPQSFGLSYTMPEFYQLYFRIVDIVHYEGIIIVEPFVEYFKTVNNTIVSGVVQTQDFFYQINGFKPIIK